MGQRTGDLSRFGKYILDQLDINPELEKIALKDIETTTGLVLGKNLIYKIQANYPGFFSKDGDALLLPPEKLRDDFSDRVEICTKEFESGRRDFQRTSPDGSGFSHTANFGRRR